MEEKKNIYQKLFEVKKAGIKLQRDTKAFNYKYATLSQIQEKFSEVLQEQKLLVVHFAQLDYMVTQIIDIESQESIESRIAMSEGTKSQDKGSEITYYRRYNLLSLLDLEVEDDDGKKDQDSKKEEKVEKKWYNDFEKHKDIYIDRIGDGEDTPESIIKKLEDKGFSLAKKTKEEILKLK